MNYDLILAGAGLGNTSFLIDLIKKLKKRRKLIKICVVDKNLKNICGGIAYSKNNSNMGFFNNPLRLSPIKFSKWCLKEKNKKLLVKFIKENNNHSYNYWLENYSKNFLNSKNLSALKEVYLPRVFYYFYLESELKKNINTKNVNIDFFQGKLKDIIKKNVFICRFDNLKKYKIKFSKKNINNLILKKQNYGNKNILRFKRISLSLGLPSPKKINYIKNSEKKNKYIIEDFYEEGGTKNLVNCIKRFIKNKKRCRIFFIGSKAGLLEPLIEVENLINKEKLPIKILSCSREGKSISPALFSKNSTKYMFKYFTIRDVKKIKKAEDILKKLKKEFRHASLNNFNKYDVWTKILEKKIIDKYLKNLNKEEIINYNKNIFNQIRNLTRFTFPKTVFSLRKLIRSKKLKLIRGSFKEIKINNNKEFNVIISNKKKKNFSTDIIVNVSGPENYLELSKKDKLIKSLVKLGAVVSNSGFEINKSYQLKNLKNFYSFGLQASGYNKSRKTIIKAITQNAFICANHVYKELQR